MELPKNIIQFKSLPRYFSKEESGKKPNTLRDISDWSKERHQKLKEATHIEIVNSVTGKCFIREITDKTKWNQFLIISWKAN